MRYIEMQIQYPHAARLQMELGVHRSQPYSCHPSLRFAADLEELARDNDADSVTINAGRIFTHMRPTAKIRATDLDGAYQVGNIGPLDDSQALEVNETGRHSMSIGDVVMSEAGEFYLVARLGFRRIEISGNADGLVSLTRSRLNSATWSTLGQGAFDEPAARTSNARLVAPF